MFIKGEQEFSNYKYEPPHQGSLIIKNWSNKVNGTHSNFLIYDYSHIKSCSHENDYCHKNGIVAGHILLHD